MQVVIIHDDIDDRIPDRKSHGKLLLQWPRARPC
jgi:hypothetical protein